MSGAIGTIGAIGTGSLAQSLSACVLATYPKKTSIYLSIYRATDGHAEALPIAPLAPIGGAMVVFHG